MARQEIDLTTPQPNGKMGEPTKSAWEKVNDMTYELYAGMQTNPDRISGFKINYVSPDSVSVSSGSASLANGIDLYSPSQILKSGLSLTQFNWYHIYVFYSSPSVPDIELSLAEPVAYYGTAKHKQGDTSRRYLGSVRAGSGGSIVRFIHVPSSGAIKYTNSFPENNVLNLGKATSTTVVSCSASIPVTSSIGSFIIETGDGDLAFLSNPDASTNVNTLFNMYVRATKQFSVDFPVSSSRSINYLMSPATTGLSVWCTGYYFER